MTIGERIREKRIELGMTQEELAHLLGYADKSAVNKIEKNTRDFPMLKLESFAKALGVTAAELLGEVVPEEKKPSFSYCLEQQMRILKYAVLLNSEGDVLLNHNDTLTEITDDDIKELEVKMASYLGFLLSP